MVITGVCGIKDDREFILIVLAERDFFRMVVSRAFQVNHGSGRVYNLDDGKNGNVSFCNIYGDSGRTESEFENGWNFVPIIHKFDGSCMSDAMVV